MRFCEELGSIDAALCTVKPREFNEMGADNIDIKRISGGIPCRFCGFPMHEIKNRGNFHFWSCDTLACKGNQNTQRTFDTNARYIDDVILAGNPNRTWRDFSLN